jgi:hypothetical protein
MGSSEAKVPDVDAKMNSTKELGKLPLLHSMKDEMAAAQAEFNSRMDLASPLKPACAKFNAVLERAFESMLLDLKATPAASHHPDALKAIYKPHNDEVLWFACPDRRKTAEKLLAVSEDGDLSHLVEAGPDSRHSLSDRVKKSDKPSAVGTPTSDDRLLWRIEKSLRAGEVVEIGEISLRKAFRNEAWSDESNPNLSVKALENGLYVRVPTTQVQEGGSTQPGKKWIHAGPFDNLELVVKPHLDDLAPLDREMLMQGLTFRAAMKVIDTESGRMGLKTQSALSMRA